MNLKEKDIEQIEKFLDGRLQGSERAEFLDRMDHDAEFNTMLREMETMVSGIRYSGRRQILQRLRDLEGGLPAVHPASDAPTVKLFSWRYLAAAASLLLIAITAWWFLTAGVDEQELFTAYYQPYPNIESPTTRSQEQLSPRERAYQLYDAEQFEHAISRFLDIPADQIQPIDNFYLALCYLSAHNSQEAEDLLKGFLSNNDNLMNEKARWYLALAYLDQDKLPQAREVLQTIIQNKSYNFEKASLLLKELK